ncbi:MAG: hypothetical protein JNL98_43335, partial [Bryobacterales bacterium]|nr:hypothetical protein [Bryobacterales bacterium]
MLQGVTYPDDGGGNRGYVKYAYNAPSQLLWTEDQATNVLGDAYDTAGRETARKVTTLASGFDGAVRRLERSYDSLGRSETVVQYDAASAGSATDGVKYTYDGWGALTKFEQDRNSAVGASGSVDDYEVSYTVAKSYGATSTNPGRRTLQRTAMVLPSGKSITL